MGVYRGMLWKRALVDQIQVEFRPPMSRLTSGCAWVDIFMHDMVDMDD